MAAPSFSIGIEEEYQIIDPQTRELKSYITQLLEAGKITLQEHIKAEMHQSMIEIGTKVCRTPAEARLELVRLRRGVMEIAKSHGLKILPQHHFQQLPAHGHPAALRFLCELSTLRRYAGQDELYSRRHESLVR